MRNEEESTKTLTEFFSCLASSNKAANPLNALLFISDIAKETGVPKSVIDSWNSPKSRDSFSELSKLIDDEAYYVMLVNSGDVSERGYRNSLQSKIAEFSISRLDPAETFKRIHYAIDDRKINDELLILAYCKLLFGSSLNSDGFSNNEIAARILRKSTTTSTRMSSKIVVGKIEAIDFLFKSPFETYEIVKGGMSEELSEPDVLIAFKNLVVDQNDELKKLFNEDFKDFLTPASVSAPYYASFSVNPIPIAISHGLDHRQSKSVAAKVAQASQIALSAKFENSILSMNKLDDLSIGFMFDSAESRDDAEKIMSVFFERFTSVLTDKAYEIQFDIGGSFVVLESMAADFLEKTAAKLNIERFCSANSQKTSEKSFNRSKI